MIDLDRAFAGMDVNGEAKRVAWTLPRALPYFDGHFPENPIFPAVGIVDASVFALGLLLGRRIEVERIPSAKFTRVLAPDEAVEIAFDEDGSATWAVTWTLASDRQSVAALSLRLRKGA